MKLPPPPAQARARIANRLAIAASAAVAAVFYAITYLNHPRRPLAPTPDQGWWVGFDQIRYLRAAQAWAAGNLDPAQHWYLPGYPLLGAPFVSLTPANPFLLPDLAMLLAALWLTAALAGRLAPGWRYAPALGAAAFLGAAVLPPAALDAWVTPWTTTPAAVLTLGCLLAATLLVGRLRQRGALAWPAFAMALCGAGVALFRPIDAAVLLGAVALVAAPALLRDPPGPRATLAAAFAAAAGLAGAALLLAIPYVAIHGLHASGYVASSSALGFEWRLVPLRWVAIMLSPRPLFPDGLGLAEMFPWIIAGLAGAGACLAAPPGGGRRTLHALVTAALAGQVVLYLAYRDLHAPGLWRFYNSHYFKWTLPLLGLYAALLAGVVLERRWRGLAAGVTALLALTPWRVELGPAPGMPRVESNALILPGAPLGVYDAILAAATGTHDDIYFGEHRLRIGGQVFGQIADFKTFPRPGGLMITPLRPLPAGPAIWTPGPGVALATDAAPFMARQRIVYGQPCWLAPRIPACRPGDPIPPPPLAVGATLRFNSGEERFLREGWTYLNPPDGRWTDGTRAGLRLRLDPAPAGPLVVAIEGSAIVPPGAAPLALRLLADGAEIGAWQIDRGDNRVLEAKLPEGAGAGGRPLTLTLEIANPRSPRDVYPPSTDARQLGLFARSLTVRAAQ